jgi:hypothetical protein
MHLLLIYALLLISTFHGENRCHSAAIPVVTGDGGDEIIERFLSSNSPVSDFFVRGWRWHTMALVRESSSLERLVQKYLLDSTGQCSKNELEVLQTVSEHVVNFNMKALHKIENDIFFPWLRRELRNKLDSSKNAPLISALFQVIDELDIKREQLAQEGKDYVST